MKSLVEVTEGGSSLLKLVNIHKKLGDFCLKDVNLTINKGEYFVILGPTGTGKTVLLELIAGLYRPDRGSIWFGNEEISALYPEERNIGFVYQDYALFPHLTVRENICFGLKARKVKPLSVQQQLEEIVSLLNIEHLLDRYPSRLSGGEQQRTALARAVITAPQILLLDEPLSALDPRTRQVFQEELRRIHDTLKTTTLHITHDFSEAMALANRIGVLRDGEIMQVGTPDNIFRHPNSHFVASFVGVENIINGIAAGNDVHLSGQVAVQTVQQHQGAVTVAIRPEDIIVSRERLHSSAQNNLSGRIVSMVHQGTIYRLVVDTGLPLTVLLSPRSVEEMNLQSGDSVWLAFKSTSVHVL